MKHTPFYFQHKNFWKFNDGGDGEFSCTAEKCAIKVQHFNLSYKQIIQKTNKVFIYFFKFTGIGVGLFLVLSRKKHYNLVNEMAPTFLRDKRAQTNHNGGAGNRKLVVCLVDDEISNFKHKKRFYTLSSKSCNGDRQRQKYKIRFLCLELINKEI